MAGMLEALQFKVGLDMSGVDAGLAQVGAKAQRALAPATAGTTALATATTRLGTAQMGMGTAVGMSTGAIRQNTMATRALLTQMPDVVAGLLMGQLNFRYMALQGLQVVEMTGGLQTAFAALAPILGPLAVGVAAVATAGVLVAGAQQKASLETEAFRGALAGTLGVLPDVAQRTAEAEVAFRGLADAVAEAEIALYEEQGALTSYDRVQMAAVEGARSAAKAKLLVVAAGWAALEVQRQEIEGQLVATRLNVAERVAGLDRLKVLHEEIPAAQARLATLKEEVAQQVGAVNATHNATNALREQKEAHEEAEGAARAHGKAERDLWKEFEEPSIAERMDAEAKLTAELARANDERLQSELDGYAAAVAASRAAAAEEVALMERRKEAIIASSASIAGTLQSSLSSLSSTFEAQGKEGAFALWAASKAAAAAQVFLSGIVAVAKAYELGPIVGTIAAVAMGAQFAALAADVATAEPPAFPRGGLVASRVAATQPGHVLVQAQPGEGIVSSQGMSRLGARGLDALNRGPAAASPVVVGVPVFGAARGYQRDELRRNGRLRSALRDAARGQRRGRLGR